MIPLYKPYMPMLPELDKILYSGALAYGEYSRLFENVLSEYFYSAQLITTSSFSMAISVVISTLEMKPGDEIIISPMSCLVSTQPFVSSGLKVVWADIDPTTGTLYPESVRNKITSKTKAIVHNHFCGYLGYIDEINGLGKEYGIPIIDDGVEAFGSEYNGHLIGNCGTDITIFSFSAVRFPNTIDGGAVIFRNKDLFLKSKLVRDCGIDRLRFRDNMGEINPDCDIQLNGFSAMMSNVNSYIGLQQMKCVQTLLEKQRAQAKKWNDELHDSDTLKKIELRNTMPNYWVYGIISNDKRKTIEKFRKKGFYASGVHINNNIYSIFGDRTLLKGVKEFYNSYVALPCGWWMINEK